MGNLPSKRAKQAWFLVGQPAAQPIACNKVQNLAFAGGSLRGLGHLGSLNAFYRRCASAAAPPPPQGWRPGSLRAVLPSAKRVSGTSVGSLVGLGLVIGLTLRELNDIFDPEFIQHMFRAFHLQKKDGKWSLVNVEPLRERLQDLLREHGYSPQVTFEQLRQLRGVSLYVAAWNVDAERVEIFSPEHSPAQQVVDAVLASSSMESVFPAERLRNVRDGRCATYKDGAEGNEMPFRDFPDFSPTNTIAFYLYDQYRKDKLGRAFFGSLTPAERDRVISIDVSRLGSMQFAFSPQLRQHILSQGRKAVETYFNQQPITAESVPFAWVGG